MQKESRIIPDIIFVKNELVLSCYQPMEADSLEQFSNHIESNYVIAIATLSD